MSELAALPPAAWIVAPFVIVLAYTVFGLTGFGSAAVAVSILAHFLPIAFLVPAIAVLDLVSSIVLGTVHREHIDRGEMRRLLPLMFVGIALGVTLLVKLPEAPLRAAMGAFAVAMGAHAILNPVLHRRISGWWSVPAGLVGGAFGAVFGAGGPVYAVYLSGRLAHKGEVRATVAGIISVSAFTRVFAYAVAGLYHLALLAAAAVFAPFAWLGLRLGSRIHTGLTTEQMRRAVGAVLVLSGAILLVRTFL